MGSDVDLYSGVICVVLCCFEQDRMVVFEKVMPVQGCEGSTSIRSVHPGVTGRELRPYRRKDSKIVSPLVLSEDRCWNSPMLRVNFLAEYLLAPLRDKLHQCVPHT